MGKKTKDKKVKTKDGYTLTLSADEMEYLQCGLHQFIVRNRENSQRTHTIESEGETHELGPEDASLTDFWAQQNVEAQKLLDKLVKETGHDLCMDGQ